MSNEDLDETFVEHLTYLNQMSDADLASLYLALVENQAWPQLDNELLNPCSLIVKALSDFAQRLAPDTPADEHIETAVIGDCIGMLLFQMDLIAMAASVKSAVFYIEEKEKGNGKDQKAG